MSCRRLVVTLCVAAWVVVGLFKVIAPSPIGFAGVKWSEAYAVGIGVAEVLVGVGIASSRLRPIARIAALALISSFLLLWSKVDADCGCLGAVQLDVAGRTVVLGLLLTLHGAELALSAKRTPKMDPVHV